MFLELFAHDKVRATIDSTYLEIVMMRLGSLDDARVKDYIADDLVTHIVRLTEKLETASDYDNNRWASYIQGYARTLKETILRIKHNPGTAQVIVLRLYFHNGRSQCLFFNQNKSRAIACRLIHARGNG